MKSRGAVKPTFYVALPFAFCVIMLLLCHMIAAASSPTATSWIVNVPDEPTTVGQLSSSVSMGRLTYLFGGLPSTTPFINITLQNYLSSVNSAATVVNFVDTVAGHVGTPVTLDPREYPPPWNNIAANITNNATNWKQASLPFPTVGANNAVIVGSAVYALAMCNVLPSGIIINSTSDADLDSFRSGWMMTVVTDASGSPTNSTPSSDNHTVHPGHLEGEAMNGGAGSRTNAKAGGVPFPGTPRVQISSFSLDKSLNPRVNASCVAHGTDIYIVGGLQLSASGPPTLTNSVAMFDTIHHRFTDSAWVHDEAVANPGVTSDDSFIYIVGGQLSTDQFSLGVFAHHVPSNVRVSEPGYPEPQYVFPYVAVINGVIVVSGSPYGTIATWSIRMRGGFPLANPNSAPSIVGGTLTATATSQNITLTLFGGITPNAGANTGFYESTLSLGGTQWNPSTTSASVEVLGIRYFENASTSISPSWIPNNNGNDTTRVEGYTILWMNFTFSVLFDNETLQSVCNISAGTNLEWMQYCSVRISTSSRCDDVFVGDVIVSPATTQVVVLANNRTVIAVGPFNAITSLPLPPATPPSPNSDSGSSSSSTPPPIAEHYSSTLDIDDEPHSYAPPMYATVCLSTSPYEVPGCVNSPGFLSTDCLAYFYTPMTTSHQTGPYMVYSSASIVPHEVTPTPAPTGGKPPSSSRLSLYIGVGSGVILMLIVIALLIWRRNRAIEGWADHDDDDGQEDTTQSFLSDKRRRSSDRRNYQSPKKGNSAAAGNNNQQQQQGLLDGKYRFVQRLGKGSFSVVYLVERVADQQRFALKYVQIGDDTDRHEAMKECEVVHRLQGHPNVIHLYDMFMSYRFDTNLLPDGSNSPNGASINGSNKSPRYFDATNFGVRVDDDASRAGANRQVSGERFLSLVMEYHERGDLGKWAKKQKGDPRVPEATVLSIAFQSLSVLHYMHSSNPPIIHRDLKPENILLSSVVYENMSSSFLPIVVTDFGLSRVMDKTFCETGVGSLPYVAPECWQRCYSTKVDIWALGCILYAVCAKRVEPDNVKVMFSESTRPDFYKKLFHELNTVYGYSEACAKFIITLLDVDPNHRPAAADALKRMKRRRAATASSTLRKESELDHSEASLKSYGSEEMGKDAQCEFYIPSDTFFGVLSNGWNLNAPTNYGTNDLPLGMVTSGPLPQMPIRHPSASVGPHASTSSRSIPSAGLQQPAQQASHSGHSSSTSSSNQIVNGSKGSSSKTTAPPPTAPPATPPATQVPASGDADDESVVSMKVFPQDDPPAETK